MKNIKKKISVLTSLLLVFMSVFGIIEPGLLQRSSAETFTVDGQGLAREDHHNENNYEIGRQITDNEDGTYTVQTFFNNFEETVISNDITSFDVVFVVDETPSNSDYASATDLNAVAEIVHSYYGYLSGLRMAYEEKILKNKGANYDPATVPYYAVVEYKGTSVSSTGFRALSRYSSQDIGLSSFGAAVEQYKIADALAEADSLLKTRNNNRQKIVIVISTGQVGGVFTSSSTKNSRRNRAVAAAHTIKTSKYGAKNNAYIHCTICDGDINATDVTTEDKFLYEIASSHISLKNATSKLSEYCANRVYRYEANGKIEYNNKYLFNEFKDISFSDIGYDTAVNFASNIFNYTIVGQKLGVDVINITGFVRPGGYNYYECVPTKIIGNTPIETSTHINHFIDNTAIEEAINDQYFEYASDITTALVNAYLDNSGNVAFSSVPYARYTIKPNNNRYSAYYEGVTNEVRLKTNADGTKQVSGRRMLVEYKVKIKDNYVGPGVTVSLHEFSHIENADVDIGVPVFQHNLGTIDVSIPATTYKIQYSAGEDSEVTNLPLTQTKTYDQDICISSQVPIKDGYTFKGWNTEPNSENAIFLKDSIYSLNSDILLYAVFDKTESIEDNVNDTGFTIHFDRNDGTPSNEPDIGTMEDQLIIENTTLTPNAFVSPRSVRYVLDNDSNIVGESQKGTKQYDFTANFLGWALSPTGPVVFSDEDSIPASFSTQGSTVTLYAKWDTVDVDTKDAEKDKYDLIEWMDQPTEDDSIIFFQPSYSIVLDGRMLILYPNWASLTRKVTYNYEANGGNGCTVLSQETIVGENVDLTPIATKNTMNFVGWAEEPNSTEVITEKVMPDRDITLYAVYAADVGITLAFFPATFTGNLDDDIRDEIQAVFLAHTVYNNDTEFSFKDQILDPAFLDTVTDINGDPISEVSAINGIAGGFEFIGEYTPTDSTIPYTSEFKNSEKYLTVTVEERQQFLSAVYAACPTLTYVLNGGTPEIDKETLEKPILGYVKYVEDEDVVSIERLATGLHTISDTVPEKEHHVFQGWNINDAIIEPSDTITLLEDTVAEAQWDEYTYTVSYDANGGEGTMDSHTDVKYSDDITIKDSEFTYDHGVFDHWNTEPDGTGTSYYPDDIVNGLSEENGGEVILYAIYNEYVDLPDTGSTSILILSAFSALLTLVFFYTRRRNKEFAAG